MLYNEPIPKVWVFLFLLKAGVLSAFAAVFLQIAVFLQPLLPMQYQIAPVCETITRALLLSTAHDDVHHQHTALHTTAQNEHQHADHQHDAGHQCQYCKVYASQVLPPTIDLTPIVDRIQVRLFAFQNAYVHVWFVLQRLFLTPQGRAPPQFA